MIATAAALLLIVVITAMLSFIGAASAVTYTVWIVYGTGLVAWLLVTWRETAEQRREADSGDARADPGDAGADSSPAATSVYTDAGDVDDHARASGLAAAYAERPNRNVRVERERAGAP